MLPDAYRPPHQTLLKVPPTRPPALALRCPTPPCCRARTWWPASARPWTSRPWPRALSKPTPTFWPTRPCWRSEAAPLPPPSACLPCCTCAATGCRSLLPSAAAAAPAAPSSSSSNQCDCHEFPSTCLACRPARPPAAPPCVVVAAAGTCATCRTASSPCRTACSSCCRPATASAPGRPPCRWVRGGARGTGCGGRGALARGAQPQPAAACLLGLAAGTHSSAWLPIATPAPHESPPWASERAQAQVGVGAPVVGVSPLMGLVACESLFAAGGGGDGA